jgi:prepilin-type N-terminal cleavage/methylation domain-containing protein
LNGAHRSESGFTLIELMLVIAILGFIALPLTAAIVVGVRTTSATSNRITSTHDAQIVDRYLPADLQSTGNGASDLVITATVTPACPGVPTGNLLQLHWTQQTDGAGSTASYAVQYVITRSSGLSEWQLIRYYCVNNVLIAQTVLARNLRDGAAGSVTQNGARVTVTLVSGTAVNDSTPYTYSISGTRRTP